MGSSVGNFHPLVAVTASIIDRKKVLAAGFDGFVPKPIVPETFAAEMSAFLKLDQRVALAIVEGVARGCAEAGMSLVGGETAQLPGMYAAGEYDLAGFAVGVAERGRIPKPARMTVLLSLKGR